jgi:hypothetical protein
MLNVLSILIGVIAGLIALIGLLPIPLLPLVNWVAFPIAVVGAGIGLLSRHHAGRNINLLIMLVSGLRLFLTWGLI